MEISNHRMWLESFGVDGPFEMSDGLVAPAVLLRDDTEQVMTHIPCRIGVQTASRIGSRIDSPSGVHHELGENLVTLRGIALAAQLRMLSRSRRLPLERQDPGEREMRLGLERLYLYRLSERR